MKKLTTAQFIEKSINVHGNKYDYSKVVYVNSYTKVTILCKEHGKFQQAPSNHIKGQNCPICAKLLKSMTLNGFIGNSIKIHGYKYNYSKVNYINSYTKVLIICPIHGEFLQLPTNHLSNRGCDLCGQHVKVGLYNMKNINEWGDKDGYFYKVELKHPNSNEQFNKVGITVNPNRRFLRYKPYIVSDIIELTEMKLGKAFTKEQEMLKKMNRYTPLENFGGHTECYRTQ